MKVVQTVGFVTQNKWILISYGFCTESYLLPAENGVIIVRTISSQVEFQLRPYSLYREVKTRSGIMFW